MTALKTNDVTDDEDHELRREHTGYMQDYWKILGLDIPVPSFGHLSDLFSELDVAVKQRCKRLARRLANGEDVTVIIYSTGLSFDRASQG